MNPAFSRLLIQASRILFRRYRLRKKLARVPTELFCNPLGTWRGETFGDARRSSVTEPRRSVTERSRYQRCVAECKKEKEKRKENRRCTLHLFIFIWLPNNTTLLIASSTAPRPHLFRFACSKLPCDPKGEKSATQLLVGDRILCRVRKKKNEGEGKRKR